jgi:MFS family permease
MSQRLWANGLIQAAAAIGSALTFPLFGALIDGVGWPYAFVISGAVTALLALAWTTYATNHPAEHRSVNDAERRHLAAEVGMARRSEDSGQGTGVAGEAPEVTNGATDSSSWRVLLRHRSLMLLTISYGAVGYIEYLFFFWMHYYFDDVLHLGKDKSRIYAMIVNLSLGAGMLLGGAIAAALQRAYGGQRWRAVVPATGMVAAAVFLILGVLANNVIMIVIWLALAHAAVGTAEAPVWTLAVELGGRHGATAAGICNTGGNAGGLVAPILTPLVSGWITRQFEVSEQAGWQWGISLGGLIGVLGAALWLWITPGEDLAPSRDDVNTPA